MAKLGDLDDSIKQKEEKVYNMRMVLTNLKDKKKDANIDYIESIK